MPQTFPRNSQNHKSLYYQLMKILVTGAAGFIGFHLSKHLLQLGHEVVGIDNLNHYYDVRLKLDRLKELGIDAYSIAMGMPEISSYTGPFRFFKMDLHDHNALFELFATESFQIVFNLAAQAGVRYSIDQPGTYVQSNVVGFANLLEACRHYPVQHLIYASSSSVYGNTKDIPFKTSQNVDNPISLYAATKKTNELMSYSYSHLFNLPTTGIRFFTVYGEWGRPDMATMLFAKAITNGEPIKVFNNGKMSRDFTYVGDIVKGLVQIMNKSVQQPLDDTSGKIPYKIYNMGNSQPVNLLEFIEVMEETLGKKAKKEMYPLQAGDVLDTYADVSDLKRDFDYQPNTSIWEGLRHFSNWYNAYFNSTKR